MKTKIFTLFLALAASVGTIFAESGTCGDNITWELADSILTISGNGSMSMFEDKKTPWYPYRSSIKEVHIQGGIRSIGNYAFNYCSNLVSVSIPHSVTYIGPYAFKDCTELTSIILPNSVITIGAQAFYNCTSLTSINIPEGVTSIGPYAFYGCSGLTSIEIPSTMTGTGGHLCEECKNLKSVYICNGVKEINLSSFRLCNNLTTVTIPNSVTSIEEEAFSGCAGLTNLMIPNSVKKIKAYAFSNVANIIYSGSATGAPWNAKSMNGYVKDGMVYSDNTKSHLLACSSVIEGDVVIPNSVTSIEKRAFNRCWRMTSVTIPNSVTSIGDSAFMACSGLTSITIPQSVTNIGKNAFMGTEMKSIICEAVIPPVCVRGVNEFTYLRLSTTLYVLTSSLAAYKAADGWKNFTNILPIAAEETETTETKVTPDATTADVVWPQVDNAYTYELVIKDKDGNVVCTLVFNAQGQLTSIAFNAPARGDAPQKTQTAGFSFEVTGLESGATYNYTLTAKNEGGSVLKVEEGSFTTKAPQGIEDIESATKATKIIREGQVLIQKGEKVFDLRGQEVK